MTAALTTVIRTVIEGAFPWQRRWVLDTSKWKVALKARQLGYTTYSLLEVLLHCLKHPNHTFHVVSHTVRAATVLLDIIRKTWLPAFALVEGIHTVGESRSEIALSNGSVIKALANEPDRLRGLVGSFLFDEFAFWETRKLRLIQDAVFPTIKNPLNPACVLRVISTPWFADGLYHEIVTDREKHPRWSLHRTDIYDAVGEGLPFDIELERSALPPETWAREYLCEFWTGSMGYLDHDRLLSLQLEDTHTTPLPPHGLFIGVDLGKVADFTAIVVLRIFDDSSRPPEVTETRLVKSLDYHEQRRLITDLITDLSPRRVVLDATAHAPLVDEVRAALPKDLRARVSGHHATHPWKKAAVESLRDRIEAKESANSLRFSFDKTSQWDASTGQWCDHGSRVLLDDLARVEQVQTPSGKITYEVKRKQGKGHGDAFSALLLALEAASRPTGAHPFKVKRKGNRGRSRRPTMTF